MYILDIVGISLLFICFIYTGHMLWEYILQHYSKRRIVNKRMTVDKYISSSEKELMKESLLQFANNTIGEKI